MNAQKRYKYLISNILKQNKTNIKEEEIVTQEIKLKEVTEEIKLEEEVSEEMKAEEVSDTIPEVEQEVKVAKKKKSI